MKYRIVTSATATFLVVILLAYGAPGLANDGGYGGGVTGDGEWGTRSDSLADCRKLIEMGSYGSAIWQLKQVLKDSPENADAHNLLAFSYRSIKRYDQAEQHYAEALRLAPDHAGAYSYQGVLFLETGRERQARDNLRKLRDICGTRCDEYQDLRDAIQRTASGA